jgi:hypothetical protein
LKTHVIEIQCVAWADNDWMTCLIGHWGHRIKGGRMSRGVLMMVVAGGCSRRRRRWGGMMKQITLRDKIVLRAWWRCLITWHIDVGWSMLVKAWLAITILLSAIITRWGHVIPDRSRSKGACYWRDAVSWALVVTYDVWGRVGAVVGVTSVLDIRVSLMLVMGARLILWTCIRSILGDFSRRGW